MEMISAKRLVLYGTLCLLLPLGLLVLPRLRPHRTPTPPAPPPTVPHAIKPPPGIRSAWTLAEAREALKAQPDNSYLQYVVLQLARHADRLTEVMDDIPLFAVRPEGRPVERFGLLTSTPLIQQRLQLEAMSAGRTTAVPAPPAPVHDGPSSAPAPAAEAAVAEGAVAIQALTGPRSAVRPWPALSASKQPVVSALARSIPADFYLAEFRSLERLVALLDTGRPWAAFLGAQVAQDATDRHARRRVQEQLAFEPDRAMQHLVERVAITGSDPFLAEGTDLTVLIQVKKEAAAAFQARTDRALAEAAGRDGAWREQGTHLGVKYDFVRTPDRRISAYAATLTDSGTPLHVRSNSRVALHRVIAVVRGRATGGTAVPALGDSTEFRHVRSLLPPDTGVEDGLVYFPEALLHRLLGPALQITEARRLTGYNHLRMIGHAAALYRTQIGKAPASLDELTRTGCAPGEFNKGALASPFRGGTYTLSADGTAGVCSVLGTADFLTPCCELPVAPATADEAAAYRAFVRGFGGKGRPWLGPIALRLRTGYRQTRVEALYLPPADNPVHAGIAQVLGGEAEPLDPLPIAKRTVASVSLRLDKQRWVRDRLDATPPPEARAAGRRAAIIAAAVPGAVPASLPWAALAPLSTNRQPPALTAVARLGIEPARLRTFLARGIGNQAGLHFYDTAVHLDLSLPALVNDVCAAAALGEHELESLLYDVGFLAGALTNPAYVAIPVKDARVVDDFLAHLDAGLAKTVPTWRDRVLGLPLQGEFYHLDRKAGVPARALGIRVGPVRYRMFWARIGDGLYIANQPGILDDLRAAQRNRLEAGSADRGPVGHAMLKLRPAAWSLALPGFRLGWEEANRAACHRNLTMLAAAARAYSFTPPVSVAALDQESRQRLVLKHAAHLYGRDCACPDGGQYVLADDGKSFSCTVHGSPADPHQPERPADTGALMGNLSDITTSFTVTPTAIRAVLTITHK